MDVTKKSILFKPSLLVFILFLTLSCSAPKSDIENKLRIEFEKFYEFSESDLGEIKISLDTIKIFKYNGFKINSIKVTGRGKPDWSKSEKILVTKQNTEILTDSEFIQIDDGIAECGVGITSVFDIKEIHNGGYLAIDTKIRYEPCCGQHEVIAIRRKIFDKNLDSIFSYESSYQNLQNGKCEKVGPVEKRKTTLSIENQEMTLVTKVFLNGKLSKKSSKKIN